MASAHLEVQRWQPHGNRIGCSTRPLVKTPPMAIRCCQFRSCTREVTPRGNVMPKSADERGGSVTFVCVLATVAALGGLLFGYDTAVIAGAIKYRAKRFELSPVLEGGAVSNVLVGGMIGAALAGTLSDRFGRKRVLLLSAVLFAVSAICSALPRDLTQFVLARMLGGLE